MGSLSQTKYYLSNLPNKTTIVRRHHPLQAQSLDLLSPGKAKIVVKGLRELLNLFLTLRERTQNESVGVRTADGSYISGTDSGT